MFFRKADEHVRQENMAFLVRIRTHKSGEEVRLRFTRSNEVSQIPGGYYVRKEIIAPGSLDLAVLEIWFDRGYRPTKKVVEGGELIPIKAWQE